MRRLAATILIAASVSVGIGVGAAPAHADPVDECSASVGEIVVVDFSHWGGPIVRACDANLSTGYDALYEAGFITEGTQSDGPDFICRIGLASEGPSSEEPTDEDCVDTPPTSAYWSYWHADAGQSTWTYSQSGSMEYHPPAGSVDAWVFGATDVAGTTGQPSFSPASVRATNATAVPVPTTTTTTQGTMPPPLPPPAPSQGSTAAPGAGVGAVSRTASPTAATAPTVASTTTAPAAATSTTATADTTTATSIATSASHPSRSGRSRIVTLGPTIGRPPSSSESAVPFVVGAAVVVGLAGTGLAVAVRRRRSQAA